MRQKTRKPIDEMQVDQVTLDANSRDDIPQLLKGLQYIFLNPILLEQVLKILDGIFPKDIDLNNGRPGMDMWSIFVMGVLRLNLNCDYDRLHNLVNNPAFRIKLSLLSWPKESHVREAQVPVNRVVDSPA